MVRKPLRWLGMLALAIACNSVPDQPTPDARPVKSSSPRPSPESELAKLDERAPLRLLPMMAHHQKQSMREHLESVQAIVAAAARADFVAAEEAARKIGYSERMGRMCRHMGANTPGFTERALAFHHAADEIAAAARDRDLNGVLTELGATLAICTGCHASYRQQVVDELAPHHP
ncbi:MAG TPA: cytochrome c [Polyangiaceae bacterium]